MTRIKLRISETTSDVSHELTLGNAEFRNLVLHCDYVAGLLRIWRQSHDDEAADDDLEFGIILTGEYDLNVVAPLIKANTKLVPKLPDDFDGVSTTFDMFAKICNKFEFKELLEQMIKYCLNDGLLQLPIFYHALVKHSESQNDLLHKIRQQLQDDWNGPNLLSDNIGELSPDLNDNDLKTWLKAVRYHIKTCHLGNYEQSTTVCISCINDVVDGPISNRSETFCCKLPIHKTCWQTATRCPVCTADTATLRIDHDHMDDPWAIPDKAELRDRDGSNFTTCIQHESCQVYYRDGSCLVLHLNQQTAQVLQHPIYGYNCTGDKLREEYNEFQWETLDSYPPGIFGS